MSELGGAVVPLFPQHLELALGGLEGGLQLTALSNFRREAGFGPAEFHGPLHHQVIDLLP